MIFKKSVIYKISIFLFSLTVQSQIKISASLGGNLSGGNASQYSLLTNLNLKKDFGNNDWNLFCNYIFTARKDVESVKTTQRETYFSGAFTHKMNKQRLLGFVEIENSLAKKISFRGSSGFGYGYQFLKTEKFNLLVSEAMVLEWYDSFVKSDKDASSLRLSTRIKFEYQGPCRVQLVSLIQPAIYTNTGVSASQNTNVRTTASIDFPLTKSLSFNIQSVFNTSTYATYISPDVKSTDFNASFGLKYIN